MSDWVKHVPRSVLAKNFGVSDTAFANSPDARLALTAPELAQAYLKLDPQNLAALHKEVSGRSSVSSKDVAVLPATFASATEPSVP